MTIFIILAVLFLMAVAMPRTFMALLSGMGFLLWIGLLVGAVWVVGAMFGA